MGDDIHFTEYQDETEETAVYPDEIPPDIPQEFAFLGLAINGEAGELAEKVKKAIREDDTDYLDDAEAEIGDILWYCARFAELRGTTLGDIAEENLRKTQSRAERGQITGEGDNR